MSVAQGDAGISEMGPSIAGTFDTSHNQSRCLALVTLALLREEVARVSLTEFLEPWVLPERGERSLSHWRSIRSTCCDFLATQP